MVNRCPCILLSIMVILQLVLMIFQLSRHDPSADTPAKLQQAPVNLQPREVPPPAPPKKLLTAMPRDPVTCMAMNLYKEARGEPLEGLHAVALVVLNRVKSKNYAGDVCSVVLQPYQFSWTITDIKNGFIAEGAEPSWGSRTWVKMQQVAYQVMQLEDFTGGATHYHASHIRPYWADKLTFVGQYGNHLFYR